MDFWSLAHPPNQIALLHENEQVVTYGELQAKTSQFHTMLQQQMASDDTSGTFGFIMCENECSTVISYISCLQNKHTICLLDSKLKLPLLLQLLDTYQPDWLYSTKRMLWTEDQTQPHFSANEHCDAWGSFFIPFIGPPLGRQFIEIVHCYLAHPERPGVPN